MLLWWWPESRSAPSFNYVIVITIDLYKKILYNIYRKRVDIDMEIRKVIGNWNIIEYKGRFYIEECGRRITAYSSNFATFDEAEFFANLISLLD
jgi:hypothetical protein